MALNVPVTQRILTIFVVFLSLKVIRLYWIFIMKNKVVKAKPVKAAKPIKKAKATKEISASFSEKDERENYLNNRNMLQEDFEACLLEAQRDTPSMPGIIAGMTFKDFSIISLFRAIKDQEEYIEYSDKYKPSYVNLEEEKDILQDMIKKVKNLYGDDYEKLYKLYNRC